MNKKYRDRPTMTSDKVTIRIDLDGDLARYFLHLKKRRGIKNNSEMVRMLIAEEYNRVKKESIVGA